MLRKEHAADAFQSMYAQMACRLCQRHAVSGLLRAIHFLQLHWEQLATDIEAGALTPRVADPSVREAVAAILRPDLELARFLTPSAPAATGRASSHACGPTPSPARALRLLLLGISTTAPSSMMAAVPWAARPPPPCPPSSTRPCRSGGDQGGAGRRPGLGRRAGAETAGAGAGAVQGEPESGRGEREERWERGRDDMWDPLVSWQKKKENHCHVTSKPPKPPSRVKIERF